MEKPLVKITDIYTNPMMQGASSPIVCSGSSTLFVENLPVLQITDTITPVPDTALAGPVTVFHNNLPLNTMGGLTSQGGTLLTGAMTVLIG